MEMTIMKEEDFIFTNPWRQEARNTMQSYMEKHQGWSVGRRGKGKTWARALSWFSWEEMGKAGSKGLGLACLNNLVGLEHRYYPWLSDTWL